MNKSFESQSSISLEDKSEAQFLKTASCSLHTVHNSFQAGLLKLKLDLDQLGCDIHFFSSCPVHEEKTTNRLRRLLLSNLKVTAWYALKHSSTRWVTVKYAIVWIIEQWDNLSEYFLKFLPKQANFQEIKETAQYKWITEHLNAKLTPAYLSLRAFIAQDYEWFLRRFRWKSE